MKSLTSATRRGERGNILFLILIAVMLIGLLTAVIMQGSNTENAQIDRETLMIRVSEIQRYASEIERAVLFITQNTFGESAIRFAHEDASTDYGDPTLSLDTQVFHRQGGGANYRLPPSGINDGSTWEFYGSSAAPSVGSDRADLMMVLPNVSDQVCRAINRANGQSEILGDGGSASASGSNPGSCVNAGALGRFSDSQQFYDTPNQFDESDFAQDPHTSAATPAPQACVTCGDGSRHFYHVIMAR